MSVTMRGKQACCHILRRSSDGRFGKTVNILRVLYFDGIVFACLFLGVYVLFGFGEENIVGESRRYITRSLSAQAVLSSVALGVEAGVRSQGAYSRREMLFACPSS